MEWYKKVKYSSEDSESVLLMYDFLMPENIEPEFVEVITHMAALHRWRTVVFISSAEMVAIMKGSYSECIKKLHSAVGESSFDEIYLARDFCGDGSPLIINAYPESTRVIYGDGFGIVGNEQELSGNFDWRLPVRSFYWCCKRALKNFLYGGPERLPFHVAVLSLPQVWSKTYLEGMELLVPKREFILRTIMAVYSHLNDLKSYCDAILPDNNKINHLFLLSNLAASGAMSQENEIALYMEIINETAEKGASIFLKAHPRGSNDVLNAIIKQLSHDYKIIVLDEARLSRLPIELWVNFIQNCTITPIFSASALNLKHIYGKDVLLPLSVGRINKYVFNNKLSYMLKANKVISQSIFGLECWDGKSVLWQLEQ